MRHNWTLSDKGGTGTCAPGGRARPRRRGRRLAIVLAASVVAGGFGPAGDGARPGRG